MVAPCPFPVNYGTPGAIRELAETLSEMGQEIHIVTYPHGEDLPVGKAHVHRVAQHYPYRAATAGPSVDKLVFDLFMIKGLCRTIWREKTEVIHAHNYEGAVIGLFAKLVTGRPMIYHAVGLMADELTSYDFIKPAFLARWLGKLVDWFLPIFPDHIITVTQELYDLFAKRGIPTKKLSMIPSGTNPAMFDGADPETFRKTYGLGSRPVVMYTGITSPFQGVQYLIKAFPIVLKEEPSTVLMIVSPLENDPDLPAHRALAGELGITDSVIFVGPHTLAELPDYLAAATVAVAPRAECPGHPIKLLNYMISGKPIVCSVGGAKGLTHMHDALTVPNHDWQAMGEAILQLIQDQKLAERLGANARETVINNFTWRVLCERVLAVYESVANRRSRSSKESKTTATTV
jgi:1,2-diacylglycerol 3-alpha-glucosyltransferase